MSSQQTIVVVGVILALITIIACDSLSSTHLYSFEIVDDLKLEVVNDDEDIIRITFTTHGHIFNILLERNKDLFHPDLKIAVEEGNGVNRQEFEPQFNAYHGIGYSNSSRVRFTIMEYFPNINVKRDIGATIIKGYVTLDSDELVLVEPAYEHITHELRSVLLDTQHIAYKPKDLKSPNNLYSSLSRPDSQSIESNKRYEWDGLTYKALSSSYAPVSPPPSLCPQSAKLMTMHTVVDYVAYSTRFGKDATAAQNEITALWNVLGGIFQKTTNIAFSMSGVTIKTTTGSEGSGWVKSGTGWNDGSCPIIDNVLDSFSYWRGAESPAKSDTTSQLYHLLTHCYVPQRESITIGLAWIQTTCTINANSFKDDYGYQHWWSGTAVTSYNTAKEGGGYLTVAHEVGHNFGTGHTDVGIMSYNWNSDQFSRDAQTAMCPNGAHKCAISGSTCSKKCATSNACGSDGCGGSCGTCSGSNTCVNGVCTTTTPPPTTPISPPTTPTKAPTTTPTKAPTTTPIKAPTPSMTPTKTQTPTKAPTTTPTKSPACTPTITCASQGRTCGTISDGCSTISCGSCPAGSTCGTNGVCACVPGTCASLNYQCGTGSDGCGGTLPCAKPCSNGATCVDNICGTCIPLTLAQACGDRTCGTASDGCNIQLTCGACSSNGTCTTKGHCTCSHQCDPNGECNTTTGACVCKDGFVGTGIDCTPITDVSSPECDMGTWNSFAGFSASSWNTQISDSGCSLFYTGSSVSNCGNYYNSGTRPPCANGLSYSQFTQTSGSSTHRVQVTATRETGNTQIGVYLGGQSSGSTVYSYVYLIWTTDKGRLELGLASRNGNQWYYGSYYWIVDWPVGTTYTLSLEALGNCKFQPYLTGQNLKSVYWDTCYSFGNAGLLANGPATFSSFSITTATQIFADFYGCMTPDEIKSQISASLGISTSQITSVTATCSSKKRSSGSPVTSASFLLNGGPTGTATALATVFESTLASGTGGFVSAAMSSTLLTSSPPVVVGESEAGTAEYAIAETATTGLSTGAIAGIAVGTVVGAIIIVVIIAAVIYKKKSREPESYDTTTTEVPDGIVPLHKTLTSGAIPVMYPVRQNPEGHRSITSRALPIDTSSSDVVHY